MTIQQIVKQGRLLRGMTLPYLAKKSKLSKGSLSKLENDPKSNPTIGTLKKIARAFGESVSYMLEELE